MANVNEILKAPYITYTDPNGRTSTNDFQSQEQEALGKFYAVMKRVLLPNPK